MEDNPVKIAIKMEVDGMAFYTTCAENTQNPLGKKMFLSFIEDEKKHLKALEMIFAGADVDTLYDLFHDTNPRKRIETVFSAAKDEAEEDVRQVDPDDISALETAMTMEQEGYDYYKKVAETAEDKEIRDLFEKLAIEEDQHYEMLLNTHTYLVDNGNWYLWEERGVIDGG